MKTAHEDILLTVFPTSLSTHTKTDAFGFSQLHTANGPHCTGKAVSGWGLYNLSVAYLGAKNYNTRAARTAPMYAFQPDVRNFRQDERDRLLREAQERARAQAR